MPGISSREPHRYILDHRTELRTTSRRRACLTAGSKLTSPPSLKKSTAARLWQLAREDELILVGDTVMIPDFSLTHRKDGRRALLEIVGFWQPDYLRHKLAKVRQAGRRDLILLVYESANVAEGTFEAVSAGEVLTFSRKPVLKEVLAAVERCAV